MNYSIVILTGVIFWLIVWLTHLSLRIRTLGSENISLETQSRNLNFRLIEIEDWKSQILDHMNEGGNK
jgi:hypothetical protein|tara:strand:+ start:1916 stop:2119 length:204 start_codon:yes stop_codon:yes gene_type:complete